jgi:hypothetical protein
MGRHLMRPYNPPTKISNMKKRIEHSMTFREIDRLIGAGDSALAPILRSKGMMVDDKCHGIGNSKLTWGDFNGCRNFVWEGDEEQIKAELKAQLFGLDPDATANIEIKQVEIGPRHIRFED